MQRGHIPERGPETRKKQRTYSYQPAGVKERRRRILCILVLAGVLIFSAWQLISYAADYFAAQRAAGQLREIKPAAQIFADLMAEYDAVRRTFFTEEV